MRVQDRLAYARSGAELVIARAELLQILDPELLPPQRAYSGVPPFSAQIETVSIQQFCDTYGVHPRTFEQLFQHIGISPKFFSVYPAFNAH